MTERLFTKDLWTNALHIFVLFGFAVTQPLLDMASRMEAFYLFLRPTPAQYLRHVPPPACHVVTN